MALACGLSVDLGSAAAPSQVPPPVLPTVTAPPVSSPTDLPAPAVENTPVPSPEPAVTATDASDPLMADVSDYYQKGFLPFENGQMQVLDDFSKSRSSLNIFDFSPTRQKVQDFALWADIILDSTGSATYPNYTGCGFAYRVQNNNEGYTAILTNDAVRMGACNSGLTQCTLFGTTRGYGTGLVNIPNGSTARFSLAVNKDHAWVLVNGTMVGQYSLYTTKLLGTGDLFYGVVSNINAGYRTSCQISNVHVWESRP